MFLLFPESIMIPEMIERLRDSDFEDWLTAALIESANQQSASELSPDNQEVSRSAVTDLWMLEIAERTGSMWRGSFHVEFETENYNESQDANPEEADGEVMSFAINTDTGEVRIDPRGGLVERSISGR
jgi:hypothetical protein